MAHKEAIVEQFSRNAYRYDRYNIIQRHVALSVVESIEKQNIDTIIDIGCGSGSITRLLKKRHITYKRLLALDLSQTMLELHPSDKGIKKLLFDFNDIDSIGALDVDPHLTWLLSSSALQWASNPQATLEALALLAQQHRYGIFTSGTFRTLHRTVDIDSPIHPVERWLEIFDRFFKFSYRIKEYRLEFESTRQMLRYIKRSGVSGGKKKLSVSETRYLIEAYPLNYLEFEVLFVCATPKR